jgi:hypothetical protein
MKKIITKGVQKLTIPILNPSNSMDLVITVRKN